MSFYIEYFDQLQQLVSAEDVAQLDKYVEILLTAKKHDQRIFVAGNGASAAIASHVSVDLFKNVDLKATTFNEFSMITCLANDLSVMRRSLSSPASFCSRLTPTYAGLSRSSASRSSGFGTLRKNFAIRRYGSGGVRLGSFQTSSFPSGDGRDHRQLDGL